MWRSKFDLEPLASEARENARHYACLARRGDKSAGAHAAYWQAVNEAVVICRASISCAARERVLALGARAVAAADEEDGA